MKRFPDFQLGEKGSLIYLSVLSFAVIFSLMVLLNDEAIKNRKNVEFDIKMDGLATNIAEAGLHETLALFKRNGSMKLNRNPERDNQGDIVTDSDGNTVYLDNSNYVEFNFIWTCRQAVQGCPNTLATPFFYQLEYESHFEDHANDFCVICDAAGREQKGFFIVESEEPKLGIVRNFDVLGQTAQYDSNGNQVNNLGDLKVRYEVWKRLVEDYSVETGADITDSGRVWLVKCIGMVYKVLSDDQGVKYVDTLSTVIQSRMIKKPNIFFKDKAALINSHVDGFIQLNANAEIINLGDPMTVFSALYGKQTQLGSAQKGNLIIDFANNGAAEQASTVVSFETVFGLTKAQVKEFADVKIDDLTDPRTYTPLLNYEIRFITGNPVFTSSAPLTGTGVLIVDGDLQTTGVGHSFEGIVWTTGDFDIKASGGFIRGTIVVGTEGTGKKNLSVHGFSKTNKFRIYFDPEVIDAINAKKFQYTMFRVPFIEKGFKKTSFSDTEKNLRAANILARYP